MAGRRGAVLGFLIAGMLGATALPVAAQVAEQQKEQLERVQRELEERREREKAAAAEASKLARQIQDLRRRGVEAARAVQRQEAAVASLEDRLADLRGQQEQRAAELADRRSQMAGTLNALTRIAVQPPQAALLAPGDAFDNLRAARLAALVVPELEGRGRQLRGELTTLAALTRETEERQAALATEAAKLARDRAALDALQRQTQAAWREALGERQAEGQRARLLEGEARELRALIQRLEEEERRRVAEERRRAAERAARERAERERAERQAVAVRPPPPPAGETGMAPGFTLPVRGRVVGAFGGEDRLGQPRRGIDIETRPNAQVLAPAEGKVVFADRFRGYGLLLIIAHGGGYHSLLAGLERIDASVGQAVSAGEPVGRMGGADPAMPVLYVEVRQRGEPVNPGPWLSASARKASG